MVAGNERPTGASEHIACNIGVDALIRVHYVMCNHCTAVCGAAEHASSMCAAVLDRSKICALGILPQKYALCLNTHPSLSLSCSLSVFLRILAALAVYDLCITALSHVLTTNSLHSVCTMLFAF